MVKVVHTTSLFFIVAALFAVQQCNAGISEHVHSGKQGYKVKGKLLCAAAPAANIKVKLIDTDFGPDPDDLMDEGYTDANGMFMLEGDTTEGTTIDPHLKIYHDCNDGMTPCQRRWKFELPNKYIFKVVHGRPAPHTLDIGTWNLEAKLPGEEHDCIH